MAAARCRPAACAPQLGRNMARPKRRSTKPRPSRSSISTSQRSASKAISLRAPPPSSGVTHSSACRRANSRSTPSGRSKLLPQPARAARRGRPASRILTKIAPASSEPRDGAAWRAPAVSARRIKRRRKSRNVDALILFSHSAPLAQALSSKAPFRQCALSSMRGDVRGSAPANPALAGPAPAWPCSFAAAWHHLAGDRKVIVALEFLDRLLRRAAHLAVRMQREAELGEGAWAVSTVLSGSSVFGVSLCGPLPSSAPIASRFSACAGSGRAAAGLAIAATGLAVTGCGAGALRRWRLGRDRRGLRAHGRQRRLGLGARRRRGRSGAKERTVETDGVRPGNRARSSARRSRSTAGEAEERQFRAPLRVPPNSFVSGPFLGLGAGFGQPRRRVSSADLSSRSGKSLIGGGEGFTQFFSPFSVFGGLALVGGTNDAAAGDRLNSGESGALVLKGTAIERQPHGDGGARSAARSRRRWFRRAGRRGRAPRKGRGRCPHRRDHGRRWPGRKDRRAGRDRPTKCRCRCRRRRARGNCHRDTRRILHASIGLGELHRIGQEIDDDLLAGALVADDLLEPVGIVARQRHMALLGLELHHAHALIDELGQRRARAKAASIQIRSSTCRGWC